MSGPLTLNFERRIPASPVEVFDAWTQPDIVREWLAPGENRVIDVATDVRVGGSFRIRSIAPDGTVHTVDGSYRELDRGRRLVMTWSYSGPAELICEMETLLEIDLAPTRDGETAMTVTQTRLATQAAADAYAEGWPTCFAKLERTTGAARNQ